MRGGDGRVSGQQEGVRQGFACGREQFAAGLRHCGGSQRAGIADRELGAGGKIDAADRVGLVERRQAGIDAERARYRQRARVFPERDQVSIYGQGIREIRAADRDSVRSEEIYYGSVPRARHRAARPVRGDAPIAAEATVPVDNGHVFAPLALQRFSAFEADPWN